MTGERIFNPRDRWLLRRRISGGEVLAGLAVLGALAATVGWVVAQKGNFNPAERDLAFELLAERPVEDRLYRTPFKPWGAPGKGAGPIAAKVELGWFPPGILSGGWALGSRLRRFDKESLFRKINGEAEKFLKQGFRELHYLALKAPSGNDEVSIELFEQQQFSSALGLFSDHREPGRKVEHTDGVMYFSTPAGAIGMNGRFFFRIAGNNNGPAVRGKAEQVVRAFAALPVKKGDIPLPFRIFTQGLGIDPGDVAFQRSNAFQYDFARNFWFATAGGGGGASRARFFLHRATSPQTAATLFEKIVGEHGLEFKVMQVTDTMASMRHPFLKTYFRIQRRGDLIYGIENAPRSDALPRMLNRLEKALADAQ